MSIQTLLPFLTPDVVNGLFEFGGASAIGYNTFRLWKDKMVRGVSIPSTCFFTSWGLWNLWYYPSLAQMFSFAGGVAIVLTNAAWLSLMWKFRNSSSTVPPTLTDKVEVTDAEMSLDEICDLLDKQPTE